MQEESFRRKVEEMKTPLPSSNKFSKKYSSYLEFSVSSVDYFLLKLFAPHCAGRCHGKNPKPSQEVYRCI